MCALCSICIDIKFRRIMFDKTEYILRSLSKITHKKWELYIISRIVHLLNDHELEFVCQQLIKTKDGNRYLMDLCFPQLKIYYEIDELHHSVHENAISDKHRKKEILDVSDFEEYRIKVCSEIDMSKTKTVSQINKEVDSFVNILKVKKQALVKDNKFIAWDPKKKFSPLEHIKRGYIDVSDNVVFLTHRDAMRCFGYSKGHYQRAVWKIPSTDKKIWFPKLYRNNDWENTLSEDFDIITMKNLKGLDITPDFNKYVVFAHYQNILGRIIYKFLGEFHTSVKESSSSIVIFRRQHKKICLNEFNNL